CAVDSAQFGHALPATGPPDSRPIATLGDQPLIVRTESSSAAADGRNGTPRMRIPDPGLLLAGYCRKCSFRVELNRHCLAGHKLAPLDAPGPDRGSDADHS